MNKEKVFETEISCIVDKNIKQFLKAAILELPDYFFTVAASSTGKYHPKYALGEGGLVRHTKAAVKILHDLLCLEMYSKYTAVEKDMMITAIILHDGLKHGEKGSEFTVAEHPTVMAKWIQSNPKINTILPENQLSLICDAISSHMGQWNTDYKSKKEILPKPVTAMQKMVHQCDYLASRKYLEVDFGDDCYIPDAPDLQSTVKAILAVAQRKIAEGCDKNVLYEKIAVINNGKKNPNSIKDLEIAQRVLQLMEEI